jgi:hypothetical protein
MLWHWILFKTYLSQSGGMAGGSETQGHCVYGSGVEVWGRESNCGGKEKQKLKRAGAMPDGRYVGIREEEGSRC